MVGSMRMNLIYPPC